MEKNYILHTTKMILNDIENLIIEFPNEHEYDKMLKSNEILRTIFRFEKSLQKQNINHLEKAMLYIDLSMVGGSPVVLANNYLLASYFLLKEMKNPQLNAATKYAYKNTICRLIAKVFFYAHRFANPCLVNYLVVLGLRIIITSQQHFKISLLFENQIDSLKSNLQNILQNKKETKLITLEQECIYDFGKHLLTKLIKVNPFYYVKPVLSGDIIYANLVKSELMENFYNHIITSDPSHKWNHLYHYYLLEGSWKCWGDEINFKNNRENSMRKMIQTKNWKLENVQNIMSWSVINRDENGWIHILHPKLNLNKNSFVSIEGVEIDLKTGEFQLDFIKNEDGPGLFDMEDVKEIFSNGIVGSIFSLDPPDNHLSYNPFQQITFGPSSLSKTHYLMTLLHADYLLKMLSMETEVSSKIPFQMRDANENLLKILPKKLRNKIKMNRKNAVLSQVNRFWIEALDLPFERTIEGDKVKYTIDHCQMTVNKHKMKYNENGQLIHDNDSEDEFDNEEINENNKIYQNDEMDFSESSDYTSEDSDNESCNSYDFCDSSDSDESYDSIDEEISKKISPEKKFAMNFSKYYHEIGHYFPIFLRLRELVKLGAISIFINNIAKIEKERLQDRRNRMFEMFEKLLNQIEWPINTEQNVERYYRLSSQTRDQIRQELAKAEDKIIHNLIDKLKDSFQLNIWFWQLNKKQQLKTAVRKFLNEKNSTFLIEEIILLLDEKLLMNTLQKNGFNLELSKIEMDKNNQNQCIWVPAAFNQFDSFKSIWWCAFDTKSY